MYYLVWQTKADAERKSSYYCLLSIRKLEDAVDNYGYRKVDSVNVYLFTTIDDEVKKDIKLHNGIIVDDTLQRYKNKIYLLTSAAKETFLIS